MGRFRRPSRDIALAEVGESYKVHENLHREHRVEVSSDRSFGLVMAAALLIVGLWPLASAGEVRAWALLAALVLLVVALGAPAALHRANVLWARFGLLLGRIFSPLALGVLFYLAFAPLGMLMRVLGKDPLRLAIDRSATTYWIARLPPGPPPRSMNDQF